MDLKKYIRNIPDFPQKGVMFRDITTLLKEPEPFKYVIDTIVDKYKDARIGKLVSVEARGYIFGGVIAYKLNCGFIPVRKPGKLPAETVALEYTLEYGKNTIEMHKDAIEPGERVLVFDDVLATGGTVQATCKLIERLGGQVVGCVFISDLTYLKGSEKLKDYEVFSLVQY
ncbi:adenine phosphoribosyltransferase [candidate division WOR_3 bacterium SM23_42]|uniref:Adenine phosphoribosyltransferase n=1 Tax=candidate division WOR_3 bacterium SM23_42 TaxID=1703779 RepID=A0A0S8FVU7_UNCW3|nr:MAG: adenine phosphoribosyltransferase [candidate division WOR_3 bacterium SM23_42]